LVAIQDVAWTNSRRVLIIPSSAPNYVHYYNTTQNKWIQDIRTTCERLGYTVDVRHKQGRKTRAPLDEQLKQGDYVCTISQHSVAALETVCAGVPAVVTGPHPCGDLATPWEEFLEGQFRMPHRDDIEEWCSGVLHNIKHKREIFEGVW